MIQAKVDRIGISYRVTYERDSIRAYVSQIHGQSLKAEVRWEGSKGNSWQYIYASSFSLLAQSPRIELANLMQGRWPLGHQDYNWVDIILHLTKVVVDAYRAGEPEQEMLIDAQEKVIPPAPILPPILYENMPTLIFAYGGTGKSWVTQIVTALIALPWRDNPLEMTVPPRPINVLYLDYEDAAVGFRWRMKRLIKGNGLASVPVTYRRCAMPFDQDYETIERITAERNIGLIIVDSVGMAVGSHCDVNNDSRAPIIMYSCLRQLGIASLLVHHTSKATPEGAAKKHAYGSAYWENEARVVYHIIPNEGENSLELAWYCTKANHIARPKPFGWKLEFVEQGGPVRLATADVSDLPSGREYVSLHERIAVILEDGPKTVAELAGETGKSQEVVRVTLHRYKDKFVRDGAVWRLCI